MGKGKREKQFLIPEIEILSIKHITTTAGGEDGAGIIDGFAIVQAKAIGNYIVLGHVYNHHFGLCKYFLCHDFNF